MKTVRIHFALLILIMLSLASCHPARKVERRGGHLLVRNTIRSDNSNLSSDELEGFIQQNSMPGRLAPFFRPGVLFYEQSQSGKETRFKLFIRKAFGEKPIIIDTNLANGTVDKLQLFLKNKGFFHSTVTKSIRYRSKTASVTYNIRSGPPCIVTNFSYIVPDSVMREVIRSDTANGKLRSGMIFDTYVLNDERDRIANLLRNNSYFKFSLSDIYYLADTANAGLTAEVEMHIKQIKISIPGTSDSTGEIDHPRFYIRNIYITPNADITSQVSSYDTIPFRYHINRADTVGKIIYILTNHDFKLRSLFLAECLDFSQGDAYSQLSVNRTYKKLISQPIIGSANFNMVIQNPEAINSVDKQWLDCNIRLVRNRLNSFSLGTEGTNSAGSFGIGLNSAIQNRNLFRGAEVISLKLRASTEMQGNLNNQYPTSGTSFLFFNALSVGAEASIDFPRLIVPYRSNFLQNSQQGRTSLSAGAGYEITPDYKRRVSTAAWSYRWNKNERVRIIFTPIELNYIKIFTSDSFQAYLGTLTDPQFKSQYTDHFLTMIRYSIILSNVGITKLNNQYFLRLNAETSGNAFFLIDKLAGRPLPSEGYYQRLGVRYSQYVKFDFDFRRYWKMRFDNSLAFRFMGGVAFAYGNSTSVPVEKSFWLGGTNDMRGWRLRSLGPGAYIDPQNQFDKTADLMFQSSIEDRFPIYSFLQGAIFVDAGNIWLLKASNDFPNGEFNFNSFYKQIAMDLGLGLRFDFSFFILRLDGAVPFKNPAVQDQWFSRNEFNFQNMILNFGIGYPF